VWEIVLLKKVAGWGEKWQNIVNPRLKGNKYNTLAEWVSGRPYWDVECQQRLYRGSANKCNHTAERLGSAVGTQKDRQGQVGQTSGSCGTDRVSGWPAEDSSRE